MSIVVNIGKAKAIAHDIRRAKRSEEFAPLDIKATIPSLAREAETQRQAVRDKYYDMQIAIDSAKTIKDLKKIL